jgi:hypothetical protein
MIGGTVKRILIAAMLTASALLFGASGRSAFSKVKVDVRLEKPPVPSVSNSPQSAQKVVPDPQWLVVRVTFHPQIPKADGPNYKTYIDGVNMSLQMLFPLTRSNSDELGLFKGEQTFWTVCCDGRTHTAMMFIPPQLINRYIYMADDYSVARSAFRTSLRVEAVFTDSAGQELGRGYFGVSGNAAKQQDSFGRMLKRVAPQCIIDGAFWERGATPWSCMAPDQFDLVKPAAVKIPNAPIPPRDGTAVRVPRRVPRPRQ